MHSEAHNTIRRQCGKVSVYAGLVGIWFLISLVVSCKSMNDVTRTEQQRVDAGWPRGNESWEAKELPLLKVALPTIPGAQYVHNDKLCAVCHATYVHQFENNVHRKESCEVCHGPASRHLETRGKDQDTILSFSRMTPAQRSEVCAKCHEQDACAPGHEWRQSVHAHQKVACTDCHIKSHYNVAAGTPKITPSEIAVDTFPEDWHIRLVSTLSPDEERELERKKALPSLRGTSSNLGAVAPNVCYQCHSDTYTLEEIAHPHQIHGPNSLNCTSCHNSHGNVLASSRKELCLECHDAKSPTAAWHSSTHDLAGVACTDCHNPHPNTSVRRVVNIQHTSVDHPPRLPMSVNEPEACYKCHPKMLALTGLPSHHPIVEGKVTCSDCHDAHGQAEGNLTEPTVNLVCYKCHADKQGPFAYEHPPVTEDCSICHEPHGTVANNLLRQPPAFLCLRCHTGHRVDPTTGDHFGLPVADIDNNPALRSAYYSDCTQCHDQIHGSDLPSQHRAGALLR
jgi:DmsE family decaheme c-type cytochrome